VSEEMKRFYREIFLYSILSLLFAFFCFGQSGIPFLKPETIQDIDKNQTAIIIRANVEKASVYLNGEFQGVTPLTIRNLMTGLYNLKVLKTGYFPQTYIIEIKRSQAENYYIELNHAD
jgi:hypothetical protein